MSGALTDTSILAGASGAVGGYDIDNSCRFNDHTAAFLYEVMNGAGSSELIWTLSFWTKIARFAEGSTATSYPAGYRRMAATKKSGPDVTNMEMGFRPNDNFVWYFWVDGSNHYGIETTPKYRDPSAWYHFTVIYNAPDSTAADRMQVWVNGERQTTTAYALGNPPNDKSTGWTSNGWTRMFGGSVANPDTPTVQYPFPGYMAEVHCIDGQALAPSNFAEADEDTNEWKAIEYEGTYGNNGFFFEFQTSGTLGTDTSGSGNNFTSSGMDAFDQMIDTPQNSTGGNFCTLNPLNAGNSGTWNGYLQEGNLKISGTAGVVKITSTFALDNVNGCYWEVYWGDQTDANCGIGLIGNANLTTSSQVGADPAYPETGYKGSTGVIDTNGSTEATYATAANGDIVAFAYKAGRLYVGKIASASAAPTWFNSGNPVAGTGYVNGTVKPDPTEWDAVVGLSHRVNFGADSSFGGGKTAQGNTDSNNNGDFYGTVPTGYLALCSNNLADPLIALPEEYFETVKFTGTGSTRTVATSLQSDLSWFKQDNATTNHVWYDSVRGGTNALRSNTTALESQFGDAVITFNSSDIQIAGTSTSGLNGSSDSMVAWNWKAGGAPTVDNSAGAGYVPTAGSVKINGANSGAALAGSIAATRLSANTTSGMSVVQYTGTGSAATIAHGLGVKPALMIFKKSNAADDWAIWGKDLHGDSTLNALKMTSASYVSSSTWWNSTDPTTSVISVGTNGATGAANEFICYVFAEIEGYSKVFNYLPGPALNGVFLYTGFKPAFWMTKMTDGPDGAGSWFLWDNKRGPYNQNNPYLVPNANYANEVNSNGWDFLSNGLKMRMSIAQNTTIGIAFAESPFKTSRAR